MGDTLLTALSIENHHPSTILSMDSSASSSHDELDLEMNRQLILTRPPDINLPFSAEQSPTPRLWNPDHCDILDVGLSTQIYETESFLSVPKTGRKCAKRADSIWGAWFFFSFYFKPVLNEKSKGKIIRDGNGISGFEKSDLKLETFLVQHDMENMYMWVFKERPENALGKMQLRSYMNGHSRQGERPFPFSVDKGFVRSHRMQRKHYRGLSNPQCVHGIEVVSSPNLTKDFFSNDEECYLAVTNGQDRIIPDLEAVPYEPNWLNEFSGVMRNVYGPVTAAKTIYEDEEGYLIVISLPFVDLQRVKVSWRNMLTHGIIKVSCTSTSRTPFIKRHNRTFKLTDRSSEHCPPGEFVREISLSTRIPEDAKIEAYYDGAGTVLEILVPKLGEGPEEHEVRVCLRPHHNEVRVPIGFAMCIRNKIYTATHNPNCGPETKTSTAKPVQSAALPLESVDDIHGRHRLPAGVLGVGHGVTDDVLEEDLQNAARLLVDEAADALHSATAGQAADRRLGDALDVVPQHLTVPFSSALAETLSALSTARHFSSSQLKSREGFLLFCLLSCTGEAEYRGQFIKETNGE
ncbi:HSP20-like chaperones superfamily protein [Striga asiatica]|uniref:HSP20-like chaperones superfamily protein n=1 Tax=Striga asiatica TaxID=4170 RepID=A0A5A7QEZ0_STRAF|nr:HSP20-like chaperones superfamily protein [Striga asiatica]